MTSIEALRGRPGIPELFGAWRDGGKITYVVGDGGEPLGKGPSGVGTQPNVMTAAFAARARDQPLALARSILECFGSWASDFFQDDLKAQQFTMDAHGTVFMVDGPSQMCRRGGSTCGTSGRCPKLLYPAYPRRTI